MAQLEYSRPAIALNRFGLGARAGDTAPDRPMAWVLDQLERYTASIVRILDGTAAQ